MKKYELEELLKHITRHVLREYQSLLPSSAGKSVFDSNNTSMSSSITDSDPNAPTDDALSPALKSRIDNEKKKQIRNNLKSKEAELKTAKDKMTAQQRETDQIKRFTKPSLEKDIQKLKGARI